jgi:hypothetical protein
MSFFTLEQRGLREGMLALEAAKYNEIRTRRNDHWTPYENIAMRDLHSAELSVSNNCLFMELPLWFEHEKRDWTPNHEYLHPIVELRYLDAGRKDSIQAKRAILLFKTPNRMKPNTMRDDVVMARFLFRCKGYRNYCPPYEDKCGLHLKIEVTASNLMLAQIYSKGTPHAGPPHGDELCAFPSHPAPLTVVVLF